MKSTTELAGRQGRIQVYAWTPEEPTCVILLAHGYGEHAGRYEHVAGRLVEEGAAVYAPDHYAHGASEGERASFDSLDDMADDLAAVGDGAAEAYPGLPIVLLGHSMGGIVVTLLAQRDPSKWAGLILSGPAIGGNPDLLGLLALDPIPEVPIDPAILSRDLSVGEAYAADELVYHGPFYRSSLQALSDAIDAIAAGPDLGPLPTLWMHGSEDELIPLEPARGAIDALVCSDLESHVYEGARHEIFNETNQDEVLDHVAAFLGRIGATKG